MAKRHPPIEDYDIENEVVTDVSAGGEPGGTRILRVYDNSGDFTIEIPSDSKVTFGYFNPGPSEGDDERGYRRGRSIEERRTALRVWKSKDQQLAVFLGVKGFRDESIKLVRIRQRIVVEANFEDDGEGVLKESRVERRQLVAAHEEGTYQ